MKSDSSLLCARELMDAVLLVMLAIRGEMRSHRGTELSVPQFRALAFINRLPGSGLSEIAEHIGLGLPSMSKMVDGLVTRGLVEREPSPADRRRVRLTLTGSGREILERARQGAQNGLARRLDLLSRQERRDLSRDLRRLQEAFLAGAGKGEESPPPGREDRSSPTPEKKT